MWIWRRPATVPPVCVCVAIGLALTRRRFGEWYCLIVLSVSLLSTCQSVWSLSCLAFSWTGVGCCVVRGRREYIQNSWFSFCSWDFKQRLSFYKWMKSSYWPTCTIKVTLDSLLCWLSHDAGADCLLLNAESDWSQLAFIVVFYVLINYDYYCTAGIIDDLKIFYFFYNLIGLE